MYAFIFLTIMLISLGPSTPPCSASSAERPSSVTVFRPPECDVMSKVVTVFETLAALPHEKLAPFLAEHTYELCSLARYEAHIRTIISSKISGPRDNTEQEQSLITATEKLTRSLRRKLQNDSRHTNNRLKTAKQISTLIGILQNMLVVCRASHDSYKLHLIGRLAFYARLLVVLLQEDDIEAGCEATLPHRNLLEQTILEEDFGALSSEKFRSLHEEIKTILEKTLLQLHLNSMS